MIKHVKHADIDADKWNKVVLSSRLPLVFAQPFYLNATSPGWDALVIGDYESVFPLTHKTKFGYTYLPQPPFTSQLGAFGKADPEAVKQFYEYIVQHYKLIEIELNAANELVSEFSVPKKTFVIDYKKGYALNQNTKRNLAKATDHQFGVVPLPDEEAFDLFTTHLHPFLHKELHLPLGAIQLCEHLLRSAAQARYLYSFKVENTAQQLKALGYFICNGKHAFFLKGTNFDKADNSGSMHFLLHHAVHFFAGKADFFDFGGGSNSEGLAGFYKGLGGEPLEYQHLKINRLPAIINLIKNKGK